MMGAPLHTSLSTFWSHVRDIDSDLYAWAWSSQPGTQNGNFNFMFSYLDVRQENMIQCSSHLCSIYPRQEEINLWKKKQSRKWKYVICRQVMKITAEELSKGGCVKYTKRVIVKYFFIRFICIYVKHICFTSKEIDCLSSLSWSYKIDPSLNFSFLTQPQYISRSMHIYLYHLSKHIRSYFTHK